jgi:RNA polymerase sigma-54 factor
MLSDLIAYMKPTLQLKMGQHLAMTPQLQQAIKLLQLSSLELQQEIQKTLDSNPLLEADDSIQDHIEEPMLPQDFTSPAPESSELNYSDDTQTATPDTTLPDDLPVDSTWEDTFQDTFHTISASSYNGNDDEDSHFLDRNTKPDNLIDHLIWQLELTPMSALDHTIGVHIIESLNDRGYLSLTLDEIRESVIRELTEVATARTTATQTTTTQTTENQTSLEENVLVEDDEILAVLHRIQQFDPPGVAAQNLQECLAIQIKQLPETMPWRNEALLLVNEHLELFGKHEYVALQKKMRVDEPSLKFILQLIQSLNPHPGSQLQSNQAQYIVPDIFVTLHQDRWRVELNTDVSPKLRINAGYAALIQQTKSTQDVTYLKNNLQEARWFIKSLQSRNETLLKVATEIVKHQRSFFEYGEEGMKPLVLHDIAEIVEMHESTISRVTTQKFMHTPRGIFELKYFFSSHVNTTSGGECSSIAIKSIIKNLIDNENKAHPLSDNDIAKRLKAEKGINAARRTVAKYRESLNIARSNERKRLV